MTLVGFVVHHGRSPAVRAADAMRATLRDEGVTVVDLEAVREAPQPDLVVSIGGDGTFLRGAHVAAEAGVPVLGVKVGRLGFLTEVEPEDAIPLIRRALAGEAVVEDRLAVTAELDEGSDDLEAFPAQWAMNEIIVEKRARHRLVRLAVEVDGDYVTTFSADGVIVATPTGSTAYSFSARGPIVSPTVPCLVLNPVAAHMVFDRSFVLGADQTVVLEVVGDEPGVLSADGRETLEVRVGTRIRIRSSDHPARFVRKGDGPGFLARVRDKFGLPGGHLASPTQPGVGADG